MYCLYKKINKSSPNRKLSIFLISFGFILGILTVIASNRGTYNSNLNSFNPRVDSLAFIANNNRQSFNQILSQENGMVLGAAIEEKKENFGQLIADSQILISPTPEIINEKVSEDKQIYPQINKRKKDYYIAIIGDSMIDTASEGYPYLADILRSRLPKQNFTIYNYGAASTDLNYGLFRLTNNYNYKGKEIPALLSRDLDLIIIESFAYNHWSTSQGDMDKQWSTLVKIVETIKSRSQARILFLSTIAPNDRLYASGIKDIDWNSEQRRTTSENTKKYLVNHINFAKSAHLSYIDAFSQTQDINGDGKLIYIDTSDYLHPSIAGHKFVAKLLADWIYTNLP